ncbi:MAG: GNAT family N-acetyltransferase [Chloroflexota bacterium]
MNYRLANFDDFERIAALHVVNWRETYRGAMLDHYLDHEVWDERHENWKGLLGDPADNQFVLLAEDGEKLCGFVCAYGNHHPTYGTLVENLHSDKSVRGQGVGKMLLARAADWSLASHPTAGLYLDVLESNTAAQGFYKALRGVHVESKPWVPPGGGEVIEFSFYWENPQILVDML